MTPTRVPGSRGGPTPAGRNVAVVTGAARGIGAAVCRRLSRDGVAIAPLDLDEEGAERVARDARRHGGAAVALGVDVTDEAAVTAATATVRERLGDPTIVVACAGTMRPAPIESMELDDWRAVLASHLDGVFTIVRRAVPGMRDRGWGRIVLVSSVAARGIADHANYGTAKAGVIGLTRSLAVELGPAGITVNAVAPGVIDTAMTRAGAVHRDVDWRDFADRAAARTALRRVGTPEDVAAVVSFLAGPDSAYVTGQVIQVSGSP